MTRYQVWKARERARFRHIAEVARINRLRATATVHDVYRAIGAQAAYDFQQAFAERDHGIPEPFLG